MSSKIVGKYYIFILYYLFIHYMRVNYVIVNHRLYIDINAFLCHEDLIHLPPWDVLEPINIPNSNIYTVPIIVGHIIIKCCILVCQQPFNSEASKISFLTPREWSFQH